MYDIVEHEYDFSLTSQFDDWQGSEIINLDKIDTLRDLQQQENKHHELAFFQIIDSEIYYETAFNDYLFPTNGRLLSVMQTLHSLIIQEHKIDNIYFVLCIGDVFRPSVEEFHEIFNNLPVFVPNKEMGSLNERMLLFPDTYMLGGHSAMNDIHDFFVTSYDWSSLSARIEEASYNKLFEDKIDKIFWRGAPTGGVYNIKNYINIPRGKLVDYSEKYPELIDARFSSKGQTTHDASGGEFIQYFQNKTQWAQPEDHLDYKYLISIDGNGCAWKRVEWMLLSNSLLFKQDSAKLQWFYNGLEPYKHYIPVSKDLGNLFIQLQWTQNNTDKAQNIIDEASKFVQLNLPQHEIDNQISILLNEYSKYQNFEISHPTLQTRFLSVEDIAYYGYVLFDISAITASYLFVSMSS